ncbi:MAG: hypothetical protein ACRDHE_10855, partial [Ktedonobacterales bacterium]
LALFSLLTGESLPHLFAQVQAKLPRQPVPVSAVVSASLAIVVVTFAIMIDRLVTTIVSRLPARPVV